MIVINLLNVPAERLAPFNSAGKSFSILHFFLFQIFFKIFFKNIILAGPTLILSRRKEWILSTLQRKKLVKMRKLLQYFKRFHQKLLDWEKNLIYPQLSNWNAVIKRLSILSLIVSWIAAHGEMYLVEFIFALDYSV